MLRGVFLLADKDQTLFRDEIGNAEEHADLIDAVFRGVLGRGHAVIAGIDQVHLLEALGQERRQRV